MARWYLYLPLLPLCLALQDGPCTSEEPNARADTEAVEVVRPAVVLKGGELVRQEIIAGMGFVTPASFPGSIPWAPLVDIGSKGLYPIDYLLHYQPLLFLEMSLERDKREVTGYSCRLLKHERLGGKLQPMEKLDIVFRENPLSVYMKWVDGARKGQTVLYVAGENEGKLLARGGGVTYWTGVWPKDIHGAEAKQNGRYTVDQFGIYFGTKRTLESMRKAQARGALHLSYRGVFSVPELEDRQCYKFVRFPYEPLEEEGVNDLTLYFDKENWLQTGSILKDEHGNLIAEYYFRDLKINPQFKKDQFSRAAL